MSLISPTNLLSMTDWLACFWLKLKPVIGLLEDQDVPVAGTLQDKMDSVVGMIVGDLNDGEQALDLYPGAKAALDKTSVEKFLAPILPFLTNINDHCSSRGKSVSSTISDLDSYLAYYNGGSGAARYANMVTPDFAAMWSGVVSADLSPAGVMTAAINPAWDSSISAEGMGSIAVGGSYADGDEVDNTVSSEVNCIIEVVTDFVGGSAHPIVNLVGIDGSGNSGVFATVDLGANNPVAAVHTTLTQAVTGETLATVTIGSLTGIVAGSILEIDTGLTTYEVVSVDSIDSTNGTVTGTFRKDHAVNADVRGLYSFAVSAGARLRDLTGLTWNIANTSHTAGKVRVCGTQDRVSV